VQHSPALPLVHTSAGWRLDEARLLHRNGRLAQAAHTAAAVGEAMLATSSNPGAAAAAAAAASGGLGPGQNSPLLPLPAAAASLPADVLRVALAFALAGKWGAAAQLESLGSGVAAAALLQGAPGVAGGTGLAGLVEGASEGGAGRQCSPFELLKLAASHALRGLHSYQEAQGTPGPQPQQGRAALPGSEPQVGGALLSWGGMHCCATQAQSSGGLCTAVSGTDTALVSGRLTGLSSGRLTGLVLGRHTALVSERHTALVPMGNAAHRAKDECSLLVA
jgi:hypothetical protein